MKKSRKIIFTILLMLSIILVCIGNLYATNGEKKQQASTTNQSTNNIGVAYNTHIENIGWEPDFSKLDGQQSGTSGKSYRLEGIKIKLQNAPGISIKYQTHIENIGWQEWKHDGEMSGTSGKSYRLEGIKIALENTKDYSVMYRVHIQDIGWQQGWVSDGEIAGTSGRGLRLEAIEIKIVPKIVRGKITVESNIANTYYKDTTINISGWKMANVSNTFRATIDGNSISGITYMARADVIKNNIKYGTINENPNPGFTFSLNTTGISTGEHTIKLELLKADGSLIDEYSKKIVIDRGIHTEYSVHVQNIGWQGTRINGEMAGTSGKSYRLEGIKIKLQNAPGVSIKYQTHIENIGWQEWKHDGEMSGTSGKSYRLEGIKIELENTKDYSVMYRVHIQDIGWQQGWVSDGEIAGTSGRGLRLEAIEIKIVPKIAKGKITVESNIANAYYKDTTINVFGWKMANVSNTFRATIDGTAISGITYSERADVIKNNPKYGTIDENPNPGFQLSLDTAGMSEGEHTIKLELLKTDGTVITEYSKKITIDKTNIHVEYSVYTENIGLQSSRIDGETAGSVGANQRIEAITINGINLPTGVSIQYNAHVENIGWQGWKNEGELAGITGKNYRLEAIRMKIIGTDQYSITYRAYIQGIGWQNWSYDGEAAGTTSTGRKMEAIQIKLVPKISKEKATVCIDGPASSITNEVHYIKGWVMSTVPNVTLKFYINGFEINSSALQRSTRQDVLNQMKGFGDDQVNNPYPGFSLPVDFSQYPTGQVFINIRAYSGNKILQEVGCITVTRNTIYYGTGTYGITGLKAAGDGRGTDLKYYQYGSGPNVLFATFAIHGYEDLWAQDGLELVQIANDFYQRLIALGDSNLAQKWTIYIFPGVNMDGLYYGYTNNGPGRTTLYSQAPGHKGIDLNRCWSPFVPMTDNRNYNGTVACQAYEAQYLRNFLLNHKSQHGQTLLVDLHGWMKQVIGDPTICSYYSAQYPGLYQGSVGKYGTGFLINWARSNLGSSTRACKSALIELPDGVYGHQSVINAGFSNKYINATLNMLYNMNV